MLNLGTPEIILILVSVIVFVVFLGLFIFFIVYLAKRKEEKVPILLNPNQTQFRSFPTDERQQALKPNATKEKHLSAESKIALPQQSEIRYVKVKDIVRCEADDNYTNFVLSDEKILISKSLKEYADLLKPFGFLRVHQSHLINPAYVKSWLKEDGGTLLMDNGDKIPVSKPNRERIKLALGK